MFNKLPITVLIALVGAAVSITGSYFTGQAANAEQVNKINTDVQVLKTTQSLQYLEVKGSLDSINKKLDKALAK